MHPINKIMVIFDPTRDAALADQPAVRRGAELARASGATLEIFACVYEPYLSGQRFADSEGLSEARNKYVANHLQRADILASAVKATGVTAATQVVWDTPLSDGIVRHALSTRPDIVVKDTHHHARLQRAIFTNTDWHLLRDCPVPLLLVKAGSSQSDGPVIAAVDPLHDSDDAAELDQEIIKVAKAISESQGGALHLFHAHQASLAAPSGLAGSIEPIMLPLELSEDKIRKAHENAFEVLRGKAGIAAEKAHFMTGSVRETILDLVEELGASVVVMGVVARGALERLFIGSTAEKVLGEVSCDVLAVKQKSFRSEVKIG